MVDILKKKQNLGGQSKENSDGLLLSDLENNFGKKIKDSDEKTNRNI